MGPKRVLGQGARGRCVVCAHRRTPRLLWLLCVWAPFIRSRYLTPSWGGARLRDFGARRAVLPRGEGPHGEG